MAEGEVVGVGGYVCTSSRFAWFSETFSSAQARDIWPDMTKPMQRYIACWEALAQLALLQCAVCLQGPASMPFALPTGSDNTSAEAGLNSLFTTAEPLSRFLRLAAAWAEARQVELVVSQCVPCRRRA